jgi:hypothetical protein
MGILFLIAVVVLGGFAIFKMQETAPPANPIVKKQEMPRINLANPTTTEVSQDLLNQETDINEAEREEAEPDPVNEDGENKGEDTPAPQESDPENTSRGDGIIKNDGEYPGNTTGKGDNSDNTPGAGSFELPTDVNYFFVDIVDLKDPYRPDDPRCFYKITHTFPELEVTDIVVLDNGKPTPHYGGLADEGWINLKSGENWLSVQVTYKLPNGKTKTFERATEPSVVVLRDPDEILIETDLELEYDNPDISFSVETNPVNAHVQAYLIRPDGKERIIPVDEKNHLKTRLSKGVNKIRFVATLQGWKQTELIKNVIYSETKIKVYSPELAEKDYRNGKGYMHYDKSISFSTRVEDAKTNKPVKGIRMDIYLGNLLVQSLSGGNHDGVVIDNLPLGLRTITIVARGVNEKNNATEFKTAQYQILIGQGGEAPDEVVSHTYPNANLGAKTITHKPYLDFKLSPYTADSDGKTYKVAEHKVRVYHTSSMNDKTLVMMRENVLGLFCYSIQLAEGLNTIDLVIVTDELYEIHYKYEVYYIPEEASDEPIGSIYISVDASSIGIPQLAAGYVDIYEDQPLSYAVLDFLKQHGYKVSYRGQSNYAMYLSAIIKTNLMKNWSPDMIPPEEMKRLEEAGGAQIWHGDYNINSLGEKDLTSKSGWVLTLNGRGISGLSNEYPQDGDICRMYFTITGAMPN